VASRAKIADVKAIASLICVAAITLTHVAAGAEPVRSAKVLVVLRTREATSHIRMPSNDPGRPVFIPSQDQSLVAAYKASVRGFDRDPPLIAALTLAFRDRAPFVELAASADRDRYMSGAPLDKPTDAARTEGYDFVLALYDDFVGLASRDYPDADAGLFTPAYYVSYVLFDLTTGREIQRGSVHDYGFKRVDFSAATRNGDLFKQTWPFLCLMNSSEILDELVRRDAIHDMAARVGREAAYPAVKKEIESYRKRLAWRLNPAPGWVERRTHTSFSRLMIPRGNLAQSVRLYADAELLLPALGMAANTVEDFIPLYDRGRARMMPDSPIAPFKDVTAPGYGAYRYVDPDGKPQLLFVRKTSAVTMQVMTLMIDDDFDHLYPLVRGKIEEMLAHSVVGIE